MYQFKAPDLKISNILFVLQNILPICEKLRNSNILYYIFEFSGPHASKSYMICSYFKSLNFYGPPKMVGVFAISRKLFPRS